MLFVILGRDGPDGARLRPDLRPAHLDHIRSYGERVKLAGPFTDGAGSMILVDFDSHDEARAMADADPYARGGVFEAVEVRPFKVVIGQAGGS